MPSQPECGLLQGAGATIDNLTYAYDKKGNRNSVVAIAAQALSPSIASTSYNQANQILAYNGKGLTYDQNGNLATKTDACGTTTYTWDARNRLTAIQGYKSDCTALVASFSYDALNRRTSKTISGTSTQYVYDGNDIVQEIANGVRTNYVRSLQIDEPLTRTDGTVTRHYLRDALGSVVALVDDTGTVVSNYTYDAFGNVTATGEVSDNPFQFTARENDGTGMYYYRARYYSPEMQRFISEDPIRLRGGINFYSYVQNNPINRIDPRGLASKIPVVTTDPAYDTSNTSGDAAYFEVNGQQKSSIDPYVNNAFTDEATNAIRDNAILAALQKFPKVQSVCGKVLGILSFLDPFPNEAH